SIPGGLKIRDGEVKHLLKKAAEPYLPAELIRRPKEGFVMPVNQWLISGLQEFTDTALSAERVRRAGVLRPAAVTELVGRVRGGEATLANRVLSVLALHVWWDDYFGEARAF